jgi:hypothetical protein
VDVLVISAVGYLICYMGLHLGQWLRRGEPGTRWPWLSLGIFILELAVLIVGGLTWGWKDFLLGLLAPAVLPLLDPLLRRIPLEDACPRMVRRDRSGRFSESPALQVVALLLLVCGAVCLGWAASAAAGKSGTGFVVLVSLVVIAGFVAVAVACWTTLPQFELRWKRESRRLR